VTDDPTGSVRKPALDEESDGLDCFATEAVSEIESADDFAAEAVEPPLAAPTSGAGGLDVWRRGEGVEYVKAFIVIGVVLGLAVLTNRIVDRRAGPVTGPGAGAPADAPVPSPPTPAAAPDAFAAAQLVARPAIEPNLAVDRRAASPRAADVARVAPAATAPRRSPASRDTSVPILRSSPDTSVGAVLPSFAAIESPIAAAPADVRREPVPDAVRALPTPAVIVPPSDRSLIERVLDTYRDAYDRLDAPAAAVVWPHVDTRALSRAFSTLAQQDLHFDSCRFDIAGAQAQAHCVGQLRYVRRVGDQSPRVRRMSWSFALERVADRWQIAEVNAN
jgi:hypothetical protein